LQQVNYMCVTAHFIDSSWKYHKKILNFCPISSHKGESIGMAIESCLNEWGIDKILTITVDNASSNDTCIKYLRRQLESVGSCVSKGKYLHVRCVAHIINLVVKDGLKYMADSTKRIRESIRYVKQSPSRLLKFKLCCEREKISSKSVLCLDVATRWNSTYLMLESAVKAQFAFSCFNLIEPSFGVHMKDSGLAVPSNTDWDEAKILVQLLAFFYKVTLKISGSTFVTSNRFFHDVCGVERHLNALKNSNDENIAKMGVEMKEKFDKYWGDPKKMNKIIDRKSVV